MEGEGNFWVINSDSMVLAGPYQNSTFAMEALQLIRKQQSQIIVQPSALAELEYIVKQSR
jgi:hypothetical protein